ncbi:MAG: hypothetical protein JXA13_00360, partial [Anaerolineales bacterium]|nr:hypothetical protein [Anaerolineales bacterium]
MNKKKSRLNKNHTVPFTKKMRIFSPKDAHLLINRCASFWYPLESGLERVRIYYGKEPIYWKAYPFLGGRKSPGLLLPASRLVYLLCSVFQLS